MPAAFWRVRVDRAVALGGNHDHAI
jgi:hypothetical protein